MASVALNVTDDFRLLMDKLPWVNWSEIAREEALEQLKLHEDFERFKKIVSTSGLSEKDAMELADKISKSMHKRLVEEGLI